jgi:hypothetical protein
MNKHFLLVLLILPGSGYAGNTIVGLSSNTSGSGTSTPVVAAGQIVRVTVNGIQAPPIQPVFANEYPWPAILGGISVRLIAITPPSMLSSGVVNFDLPILEVAAEKRCALNLPGALPCGFLATITAQIPYTVPATGNGQMVVSENGVAGDPIPLTFAPDQIQAIAVIRSNGTIITAGNPADAGENLALFAYGLGAVSPEVAAGQTPPSPPATASGNFTLYYDVRYDAPPYYDPSNSLAQIQPDFIGLVPGLAGLYQINFKAPVVPADNRGCPIIGGIVFTIIFHSNVTINLRGNGSFNGIGICVKPPSP